MKHGLDAQPMLLAGLPDRRNALAWAENAAADLIFDPASQLLIQLHHLYVRLGLFGVAGVQHGRNSVSARGHIPRDIMEGQNRNIPSDIAVGVLHAGRSAVKHRLLRHTRCPARMPSAGCVYITNPWRGGGYLPCDRTQHDLLVPR